MKVTSVHSLNQNVSFKNRQAYYLYSLTEHYDKLKPAEKELLKKNNFNKKNLETLQKDLYATVDSAFPLDNINGWSILARHDNSIFEIGETCKLLFEVFFRGIRLHNKNFELTADDISKEGVSKVYKKITDEYRDLKNNMKGGTEEEFYKSKTLDILYSPEYKVNPQKTKKGYLTTIINNETGKPENVYITMRHRHSTSGSTIFISKDSDFNKHPAVDLLGCTNNIANETSVIGVLEFTHRNNEFTDAYVYAGDNYSSEEYSGVAYRLIQALIEYSLQKKTNIVINSIPDDIPLYTKAGFRVNPQKDKLVTDNDRFIEQMLNECDKFGISKEEFKTALKRRTKDGVSGFGKNETTETFNRLLYQKSKNLFYPPAFLPLELTSESKAEWIERIKSQPILNTNLQTLGL